MWWQKLEQRCGGDKEQHAMGESVAAGVAGALCVSRGD